MSPCPTLSRPPTAAIPPSSRSWPRGVMRAVICKRDRYWPSAPRSSRPEPEPARTRLPRRPRPALPARGAGLRRRKRRPVLSGSSASSPRPVRCRYQGRRGGGRLHLICHVLPADCVLRPRLLSRLRRLLFVALPHRRLYLQRAVGRDGRLAAPVGPCLLY